MRFDPRRDGSDPCAIHPPYKATVARGPALPPLRVHADAATAHGPRFDASACMPADADLTRGRGGEPIGERIVVTGRVTDEDGRPVRDALIEIWQCNAAGRYRHAKDQHDAPLDPHFDGHGRTLTDGDGRYRFLTIKPGPYPWPNHGIEWRPAHVHFSLFGNVHAQRLVTQMYFEGDPLLSIDPVFQTIPDEAARRTLVSRLDMAHTLGERALGHVFDIVLRGRGATPFGL